MNLRIAAGLMILATLGACSSPSRGEPSTAPPGAGASTTSAVPMTTSTIPTTTTAPLPRSRPGEYRPGLEVDLFLPESTDRAPLVVMVPGGGWRTADPSGLTGLAEFLSGSGIAAASAEISAAEDGALYPTPVEDIHCAVAHALAGMESAGLDHGPVVLLGHSSGAHLAALAAAIPEDRLPDCLHPTVTADGLVGLAGVYDVTRLPALAYLLFGVTPEEDPGIWEEGNPLHRAGLRPEVPVLLLHGASDPLVPVSFSEDFAAALRQGGHDTTLTVVRRADHRDIFTPDFSGELIADWVAGLGPAG